MHRFPSKDDDEAFAKESRRWEEERRNFVESVSKPLEIHCFTCHYNCDEGLKPQLKLMKNPACDCSGSMIRSITRSTQRLKSARTSQKKK